MRTLQKSYRCATTPTGTNINGRLKQHFIFITTHSIMLIDYQNVNIYQGEELILKDVNFDIDEGQFVYIIGKVGSGKSSLLKTLYCELDLYPDEV